MSVITTIISSLALALAVALVWVCLVGMIRAGGAFERLHFPGAAVLVGGPAIALALSVSAGWSTSLRASLISALLVLTNGILTHATARAEWLRRGSEGETPDEEGQLDGDP